VDEDAQRQLDEIAERIGQARLADSGCYEALLHTQKWDHTETWNKAYPGVD